MSSLIDFSKLKNTSKEDELVNIKPKIKQTIQSKIRNKNGEVGTKSIVLALVQHFKHHKCTLNNAYVFNDNFENDFVTLFESGYIAEIEIKVSRSDFQDDFSGKVPKHELLKEGTEWEVIPNKFYYCTPRGLLLTSMIPSYAGLIEATSDGNGNLSCTIVKEAPFIHKQDVYSKVKDRIFRKLAWRYRQMLLGNYEMLFVDEDGTEETVFESV